MGALGENGLMTLEEAGIVLGVSKSTLRRWIGSGYMPCVRVGARRDRRFDRGDLDRFIENQIRENQNSRQTDSESA